MLLALALAHQTAIWAQGCSSGFCIPESFIGPGGNLDSGSPSYQFQSGQQAVGNTGAGQSGSANFSTQSGTPTTSDPRLSCVLNAATLNFGNFSTAAAVTATATFNVLNYTSYGYTVSILGATPSNGSHNLSGVNPTDTSHTGTEQFGINLVANTSPASFGANPVQVPDNTFSFGAAATNYDTSNNYRYVAGETIASSVKTSGETDYTISYIVNTATTTPGGKYTGNQVILCTGTY